MHSNEHTFGKSSNSSCIWFDYITRLQMHIEYKYKHLIQGSAFYWILSCTLL